MNYLINEIIYLFLDKYTMSNLLSMEYLVDTKKNSLKRMFMIKFEIENVDRF